MQLRSEHIANTVHLPAFPPVASLAIDEKSCGPEAEAALASCEFSPKDTER
jgi:hypothetical protein